VCSVLTGTFIMAVQPCVVFCQGSDTVLVWATAAPLAPYISTSTSSGGSETVNLTLTALSPSVTCGLPAQPQNKNRNNMSGREQTAIFLPPVPQQRFILLNVVA